MLELGKEFNNSVPEFVRKGGVIGKSLNAQAIGVGITRRKEGVYQTRFANRFGNKKTIYAQILHEISQKLRALCITVRDVDFRTWNLIVRGR